MNSLKSSHSLISFGELNQFVLTGIVMENNKLSMILRTENIERKINISNPTGKDFTGCKAVVWGRLNSTSLTAEHYHVFTPEGVRIHAS